MMISQFVPQSRPGVCFVWWMLLLLSWLAIASLGHAQSTPTTSTSPPSPLGTATVTATTITTSTSTSSTSISLSYFSNPSIQCSGSCLFHYLSTGYVWSVVTSTVTLTVTENEAITLTVPPIATPEPADTWVISLTSTSQGQTRFIGAGQVSYGALSEEYTTTFTLTRSNGNVQRYDGFFTETPPSDPSSAIRSCFGPQDPNRPIYCCDPGYTTNFDLSYTGVLITGGPTEYYPQIPGLNTDNCKTILQGGLTFVSETTIFHTTFFTVSSASSSNSTGPSSAATASPSTNSTTSAQPASALYTYFPTSTPGTPISTIVRTSTMTLFFPETSVSASIITSVYSFNETIIRAPRTTSSRSTSTSVTTTATSVIVNGSNSTMTTSSMSTTTGTTSAPSRSSTGAGAAGTSATTSTVKSFGVRRIELDMRAIILMIIPTLASMSLYLAL